MKPFEEVGKLEFWDSSHILRHADILVASDEPMRALEMLTNSLPGYYRDNPPPELLEKINKIRSKLATPHWYMTNKDDFGVLNADNAAKVITGTFRGQQILKDVQDYNRDNELPHIIDFGPGEYWLPIGLEAHGCGFTYQDLGLCEIARRKARGIDNKWGYRVHEDQPVIYIATEIIEHLHHEQDIATECFKICPRPDIIHISTPKYTFDPRADRIKWTAYGELGHLRTYTPNEFIKVVCEMFRGYNWFFTDSVIMHMRGIANGN